MDRVLSWKDALAVYKAVRGYAGVLTPEERRTMVEAQGALLGRCCGQTNPMSRAQLDAVLAIGAKALAYAHAHGIGIPR
jgi:hypothetical protein